MAMLAWQANIAYCAYAAGNIILYCASLDNPSYVPTQWSVFHYFEFERIMVLI